MLDEENRESQEECVSLLSSVLDEIIPFAEGALRKQPELRKLIAGWHGDEREKLLDLLGNVAWEIFSENNEVVGPRGKVYDLGSWRGSGGFIADVLNSMLGKNRFDYIDFYMGLMSKSDEDLRPLYTRFFELLRARGCTWRYAPPAMFLISLRPPEEDERTQESYDPEEAVRRELENEPSKRGMDDLASEFAQMNEEAYWKAVENPPVIVGAYEEVYGSRPEFLRFDR